MDKRKLVLSAAIAALLSACGGGGGGGGDDGGTEPPVDPVRVYRNVTVIDDYLESARVYVDLNGDKKWNPNEPTATTDSLGVANLDITGAGDLGRTAPLIATAQEGVTVDSRNPGTPISTSFALAAGQGDVVTPLTTLAYFHAESTGDYQAAAEYVAEAMGIDVSLVGADLVSSTHTDAVLALTKSRVVVDVILAQLGVHISEIAALSESILADSSTASAIVDAFIAEHGDALLGQSAFTITGDLTDGLIFQNGDAVVDIISSTPDDQAPVTSRSTVASSGTGQLQNARAFVDLNDNYAFDEGEPFGISNSDGRVTVSFKDTPFNRSKRLLIEIVAGVTTAHRMAPLAYEHGAVFPWPEDTNAASVMDLIPALYAQKHGTTLADARTAITERLFSGDAIYRSWPRHNMDHQYQTVYGVIDRSLPGILNEICGGQWLQCADKLDVILTTVDRAFDEVTSHGARLEYQEGNQVEDGFFYSTTVVDLVGTHLELRDRTTGLVFMSTGTEPPTLIFNRSLLDESVFQ